MYHKVELVPFLMLMKHAPPSGVLDRMMSTLQSRLPLAGIILEGVHQSRDQWRVAVVDRVVACATTTMDMSDGLVVPRPW